ncbi:glycosyltransferase family protein [Pyxidicoccus sp. MSG2]|uniref:glycosyltransferase family protein n=1 Tax=Pyxidicoccus sp. MSG2 TaxID=2996790 RepID=UPI002271235B|nr:glycosyltransferase [Pyxidicoccus sp. MSG2]MCY1022011.1 glycosyltransferase [Pyxidicoccus sp. MSG2]
MVKQDDSARRSDPEVDSLRRDVQQARQQAALAGPLPAAERDRLRVLYVTSRDDAPFRYRCVHACEQLRAAGVVANIAHVDGADLLDELPRYSLVILFRLEWNERVGQVVQRAREAGATVGFDIDDLIFDEGLAPLLPFLTEAPRPEQTAFRKHMAALHRTLRATDFCLGTTPRIARHATKLGVPGLVHPNLLSHDFLRLARAIYPLRPLLQHTPYVGYMSGSKTHDGDLASISVALADVLARRQELRLLLCGHLDVPESLRPFASRIDRVSYQHHLVYPWLLARCRVQVAPLETLNDFTHAKSALKVFEAGVFGVPAIASPMAEYEQAIIPGVTGQVARTHGEWVDALLRMTTPLEALRMGRAARRLALDEYSPQAWENVLAWRLLERAGRSSKPAAAPRPLEAPWPTLRKRLGHVRRVARQSLRFASTMELGNLEPAWVQTQTKRSWPVEAEEVLPGDARLDALESLEAGHPGSSFSGEVLVGPSRPAERSPACGDLVPVTEDGKEQPGRFRAPQGDPWFVLRPSPELMTGARHLVVGLRAQSSHAGSVRAQLFWEPITEENSLCFDVLADGKLRYYAVDLGEQTRGRWPPRQPSALRFDPIDRPGEFELVTLALLTPVAPSVAA